LSDERDFNRDVGRRLRQARKRRGLSLMAVEEMSRAEFKPSALGSYERGERALSVHRLHRLSLIYGISAGEVLDGPRIEEPRPTEPPRPATFEETSGGPRSVLVVDDDPAIREIVSTTLKLEGYETMTAADGVMALELLTRARFEVIVLDAVMPRMDGLTVLRTIRSDPNLAETPVLMLSALTEVHHLERGVEAGANGYLTKPFDFRSLLEQVHRLAAASHETVQR
jgi:CheY-like chemotaxis protein